MVSSSEEYGAVATPKGGMFENLVEVMFAPAKVFDRARAAKAGMYALVTAIIVGVVLLATKNLLQPWFDAQSDLAIKMAAAKGTPMPEAAISTMRKFTAWGILIGAPLTMLIGPYINAIFIRFAAKLVKAPITFGQAAMVAVLSGVPRILAFVLMPVQALLVDGSTARSLADLSLSPARFVDPLAMSPAVLTLLSNLDVFRVWQIVLVAIGVAVVARVSRGTGAIVAILMWGLAAILQLLPTALA